MADKAKLATQRVRNPWGQGERLRTEILDAAVRLFSELGGEEALTIRGVARAVGIAPASIYQHFADKAALVRGVIEHDYEQLSAAMREADQSVDPGDVVGRVRAQMHAYCRFALANPGHYRLMLGHRHTGGKKPDGSPLQPIVESVVVAFERCERAGRRLRVPSDRAAVMVFVGTHGRVALYHSAPDDGHADRILPFVDELIALVFD